jgi:hypothetical protein
MKKSLLFTICVTCIFFISLPSFALDISIEAVKDGKVPASYAEVVKDNGQERVIFSDSSTFYSPQTLNQIFNAYGIHLTAETMEGKACKVPGSCAKVLEVKGKKEVVFEDSCCFYGPSALNNILNAYGVHLKLEALKATDCKVPASYAQVVKDGEKEKVVFSEAGTFYGPSALNAILNAYK